MRGGKGFGRGRGFSRQGAAELTEQKHGLVRQSTFAKRHRVLGSKGKHKGEGKSKGKGKPTNRDDFEEDGAEEEKAAQDGFYLHQQLQKAHADAITAICIAHDAIYTSSRDKTLKRWKAQPDTSGRFNLFPELVVPLGGECWSMVQAGEWLFCGLSGGNIRAFSKEGGKDVTLTGHSQGVSAMIVHQNVLISGSAEGTVRCWQMNEQVGTFVNVHTVDEMIPGQVRCLAAKGEQLWVGSASGVTVVDLATLQRAVQLEPKKKVSGLLEFQGHIISSYGDGSVCIFDGEGKLQHTQPPPPSSGGVLCILGLESGPRVLFGHTKGKLSSIALPSFELQVSWQAFGSCPVRCICSACHGGIFITGSEEGDLQLWQRRADMLVASATQVSLADRVPVKHEATDGAPCCVGGHLCIASSETPNSCASWNCSICNATKPGERWYCGKCQDSICFLCFPMYIKGERRLDPNSTAADRSEAEQVLGTWCEVKKHSGMGCAVITFKDESHRTRLLEMVASRPLNLGGIHVDVKEHMEKRGDGTKRVVPRCAFAGWKQPKQVGACKLLARTIQVYLDRFCERLCPVIALDD